MRFTTPALAAIVALLLTTVNPFAFAEVSPAEAEKLKSELTPLGAERAGNKEGTIPAWDGGYTQVWPGYRSGQPRPDPFAGDKPLFQITAKNMEQYAGKLSDGIKAMLQRHPTYRLDVYPTRRTAAAPQAVYDNTFRNATRARLTHNGMAMEGVFGGIPFPIPKSAYEVMKNHLHAWKGESVKFDFGTYIVIGGKPVLSTAGTTSYQFPYYYQDTTPERFNGYYILAKIDTKEPPLRAGEALLIHDPINMADPGRQAWQYLVGQRRIRRTPNISYDNPNFFTSGMSFFDEQFLFIGNMDRYDWKLLGKKEMFIPYNTQQFHTQKVDQVLGPNHLNPDHVRWELHRVWVLEATLAAGKRHALPKRVFYLDEDTWLTILADSWDARGQLWHTASALPFIAPELPAVVVIPHVIYDFLKGGYSTVYLFNERQHYQSLPRRPESDFSPATLAAEGIR
jgi:hypothetical protein